MATLSLMRITILIMHMTSCIGDKRTDDGVQGRIFGDLVRWNSISRVIIGVQITLPLSTFMPKWDSIGRSGRTFILRKDPWSSGQKPTSTLLTCPSQRVELEDYLNLMGINEKMCQERLICELSSDPVKYQPISQFLLPKLFHNAQQLHRSTSHVDIYNSSTYYLMRAANIGVDPHRECQNEYKACPRRTDDMINMWMLWGFQLLSRYMDIKFITETDSS